MRANSVHVWLSLILLAGPLAAAEFRPVAVWTDAECFPTPPGKYAIDKMIDGDLGTYACLLDDTRTGKNSRVYPPKAAPPVTATFVLDLGTERTVSGMRLVARNAWVYVLAKNVSVFACADGKGRESLRPLVEKHEVPATSNSNSAFVDWPPVATRYLKVRVNDSYQKQYPGPWMPQAQLPWCQKVGLPTAGDGKNLNIQIAEIACYDARPADYPVKNPPEVAFPQHRLQRDWLYQDAGLDTARLFTSTGGHDEELSMVEKVLSALPKDAAARKTLRVRLDHLVNQKTPAADPQWRALYFDACAARRAARLQAVRTRATQFIYVKHGIYGCMQGLVGKYDLPDEQVRDYTYGFKQGGQLCVGTLLADGTVKHEVLLEKPEGAVCYPSVSWDARTLVFSMRDNFETDSYYLYKMDLATRRVSQLTFPIIKDGKPLPVADCEPTFLPDGRIIFTSTRDVHISDCWYRAGGNLYCCEADGSNIRRLTFDQLMTSNPQVLQDGRIVYTRWEYNDRSALFNHPLLAMNPDGTAQTEYYGNNSMFPAALIHARGIPGSQKVIALVAGHHSIYKGKLGLVDRTRGIQAGVGIEFVNMRLNGTPGREQADFVHPEPGDPSRPYLDFKIDIFGQFGPQYSHPYAFDEDNYLCSFCPEGYLPPFGPFNPPLGLYYMKPDGTRELLAFDDWQGTGLAVPVMRRTPPPVRASLVHLEDNHGVYTIQDVYEGPGLAGVPRGTAKKLRVVALEYRVARMGYGQNGGECETGLCQTPISLNSGSWDVKHVLGEVDIEADGSCSFEVPAHTPVYFQVLDAKGCTIQSMRSWSTLQSGEHFSCVGCHENKSNAAAQATALRQTTLALAKPIQKLKPFAGKEHPLLVRLAEQSWLDSVENYLGVNAPRSLDPDAPVDGFSYVQEIQPIFDRHCTSCHNSTNIAKSKISLTGEVARPESVKLIGAGQVDPKRAYTQSYVAITTSGDPDKNPWMTWLKPRSRAVMLPPYHTGSSKSRIMNYFAAAHYDVKVSENEKRRFACWLDLLVPFCGSYTQHNTWTETEKAEYHYFQEKRRAYAELELKSLRQSFKGRGPSVRLISTKAAKNLAAAPRKSVILNPYQGIDWRTCGRHKAALHLHTLQSDGHHEVAAVVDAYRKAGFEILSITDHDWNYPNARIQWKHLPPEKASPYPKGPRRPNFPADPTWPWSDYGCAEPAALGVVGIQGNELTFRHHINSYFSDYGVWYTRTGKRAPYGGIVDDNGKEVWEDDQLLAIRDKGGLAVINHPGIPSKHTWWERKPLAWYVDRYQKHPANYLIGLEMANNEPPQCPYDEGLWDQLLARFMPRRPIWGFANDDMHEMKDARQAFTVFMLDKLNEASVRKAMQSGRFCICTSTKKTDYSQPSPKMAVFPKLAGVEVDDTAGTIRLQVADCDEVRWISAPESLEPAEDYKTSDHPWPQGRVVHVGDTLNYRQVAGIHNYVRAELRRAEGQDVHRTLTNPFGIGSR